MISVNWFSLQLAELNVSIKLFPREVGGGTDEMRERERERERESEREREEGETRSH